MPSYDSTAILSAILNERLGFTFAAPDRPSDQSLSCIVPILRQTSQKRQYVTYPETDKVLTTDSGSINRVNMKNTSTENVFVRSGTIFAGKGTQSRALMRSAILFPGDEVGLDVRCVHASHGICSGSQFTYGGVTPLTMDQLNYTAGYRAPDQSAMWASVSQCYVSSTGHGHAGVYGGEDALSYVNEIYNTTQTYGASSGVTLDSMPHPDAPMRGMSNGPSRSARQMATPSRTLRAGASPAGRAADNLLANQAAFAKNFDDVLSKARLHDDQTGIALITEAGCQTVELFDLPVSWEALHKDAVTRMGTELLRGPDKANVFEYKPERATAAVKEFLGQPFTFNAIYEHKPNNGEPHVKILGLTGAGSVGEAVELDGRLMHLLLFKN